MRNKAGHVGGFLNVCPHRGATVCLAKRGNQKVLTCPYHGWSFNTDGTLVGQVTDEVTQRGIWRQWKKMMTQGADVPAHRRGNGAARQVAR